VVKYIANMLVLLGLIGTVLGFIIALSGVSAESAGDVDAIQPMVGALLSGMATALYTTLTGAVLSMWLGLCYRVLATKAVMVITDG
jgi:biopolymer transport protein ExbB/TolQ